MTGHQRRPGGAGRGVRGAVLGSRPAHSTRLPSRVRPGTPAASGAPGAPAVASGGPERTVPWLRVGAAYAWRLILVGIVVYGLFTILGRFQLVAVALFLALVITAILRPVADLLNHVLPRPLCVALALVGSILVLLGLFALVGHAVAGESAKLAGEFRGGIHQIEQWLRRPPFRLSPGRLAELQRQIMHYLSTHRSSLLSSAASGLGRVVEVVTGIALALFSSVFFIHSGDRLWGWAREQLLPAGAREGWDRAGRAAWHTFAGYTRGIIIVAATNAVLVGVALLVLRVPLALPLALLEFFAAFVPLVGSPVALAVATVVALAGRGPVTAALVLALIVVIGQLEGHVLHPLVMSWAVRLHPLVVALSVIAGSIVAGVIGAVVAVPLISVVWAVLRALRAVPP
ncbi:AI-2E family transporter [Streptomyces sp. NPDC001508]|uniref:AI-2E family transporter n=1 Tax=Streptomyces sp. NPDC001508 TaxID=3154656 RepID=UPI00331C1995